MGNTWRKTDTFRDKKHQREVQKNRKRMKKLAKKHGATQVSDVDYQDDYESHYGEDT